MIIQNNNISQVNSTLSQLKNIGLYDYLDDDFITDIYINRPGEIFVENLEEVKRYEDKRLSYDNLYYTAKSLCILNNLEINSRSAPIYAVVLPTGERGQIIMPPACESRTIVFAIRKPSKKQLSIKEDWIEKGKLSNYRITSFDEMDISDIKIHSKLIKMPINHQYKLKAWEEDLLHAIENKDLYKILQTIAIKKLSLVTVGSTGSGKTSFCRSLSEFIPATERIITLEDTFEFYLPYQPNHVHLFYDDVLVSAQKLLFACMRLKPDRIFLTELRSAVAWDYIKSLKTGHPGGWTSVHANDSLAVPYRITDLCVESSIGRTLSYQSILRTVRSTIDIVFFFQKTNLVEVHYNPIMKKKAMNGEF